MAQWTGQFSGMTHETKVRDIEESLRQAIDALTKASEADRDKKAKAVRHLSERLLAARLKALRARISVLTEAKNKRASGTQVMRLRMREQELDAQGISGIFREFRVPWQD